MSGTPTKSTARRALTALMWLPPVAVGTMYAFAWNHLPPTIPFGFPNAPERWATRKEHLTLSLAIMSGFATLGTSALSYFTEPGFASYAVLGFFYLMELAHLYVNYSIISLNVETSRIAVALTLIASIAAALVIISVGFLGQHAPSRKNGKEVRPQ